MEVDLWLSSEDPADHEKGLLNGSVAQTQLGCHRGQAALVLPKRRRTSGSSCLPAPVHFSLVRRNKDSGPDLDPHRLEGRKQVAPLRFRST